MSPLAQSVQPQSYDHIQEIELPCRESSGDVPVCPYVFGKDRRD